MAEDALDNVPPGNETSTISLDGRRLTTADLSNLKKTPVIDAARLRRVAEVFVDRPAAPHPAGGLPGARIERHVAAWSRAQNLST
jgi:hypothetical protein